MKYEIEAYTPGLAYLGTLDNAPSDAVLVVGDDVDDAHYWCDALGNPDTASFAPVQDPLVVRLRARLQTDEVDGFEHQFVEFQPHPEGAITRAGRDLQRLLDRMRAGPVAGDRRRDAASSRCRGQRRGPRGAPGVAGGKARANVFLVADEEDPRDVALVAAYVQDPEEARVLAATALAHPRVISFAPVGVIANFLIDPDGKTRSDDGCALDSADSDSWLLPLRKLLCDHEAETT